MEEPLPAGAAEPTARKAAQQQLPQPDASAATPAELRALLAEALARQDALQLENQQLHATQQLLAATAAARLHTAEAVVGSGSYELDLATNALHFSDGMCRVFGEAPGTFEPSQAWIDARSDPDDARAVQQVVALAVQERRPYRYTRRIRRADGQWRTLESQGRVVSDAAGQARRLEGVVQDITARKHAEQELLTAQERLRATLDSSLYVVQAFEAVRDAAGRIVDFTWVFTNKTRVARHGEVVGKRLLAENPGMVETGLFDLCVRVTETGEPVDHELHYGHEQFDNWFHQTLVQLGDGFVMNTEDITARKIAEQRLQASRELLQATLDSSLDMVQAFEAVRDEQGTIVDFTWTLSNEAAEKLSGPVIGQRLLTHNPGVVEAGVFDIYRRVVETGQPDQTELHYTGEHFDHWFLQSTVKLRDGVATTHADTTAHKQAEQEVLRLRDEVAHRAEDKYHALLSATTQGFCLLQLLFNETGQQAVDFRYLELSPAFVEHAGLPADALGKTVSELVPDLEPLWLDTYGRVALTGQAEHLEYEVAQLGRWYDAYAFRVGPSEARQVGVLFSDVTARKQAEARQQFLLQLSDALRPLADPRDIQRTATRVLGAHFGLDRAMYAEITPDGKTVVVHDNYLSGRFPAFTGTFPLAAYGPIIEQARRGEPLIVDDVDAEAALTDEEKANYKVIGSTAFISYPLLKGGRWVANLVVHQGEPRRWTTDEVALLRETAERTWAAVERAHAEEALRLSEERLRALLDNLPGGAAFIIGPDLRYQLAAGEALTRAGLTPVDFVGRPLADVLDPEALADYRPHLQQALAGEAFVHEHLSHGRDFVSRGVPLRATDGAVTAVLVVSYDITDRRRAEEALRHSEEQFRTMANLVPDLLWRSEPDSNTTWYNQRWLDYTGQTLAEAAGDGWADAIHPDDRERSARQYRTAVHTGQPLRQEHRIRSAGGEYRWFVATALPARDAQGTITHWFGAATDIEAQKQAEAGLRTSAAALEAKVARRTQALQESRDLLQSVFDTNLILMAVFRAVRDEAGTIQDFEFVSTNREFQRDTGRTDLVGRLYAQEYPGIRTTEIFGRLVQAVETGQPQTFDHYYGHEGYDAWFTTQFVQLGDGAVATSLDITERKTAEQQLTRNLQLLEQAEAVARLGSWDYDRATGQFLWSGGMYQLFGLPPDQPITPAVYLDYVLDEDRPLAERLVQQIRAGSDDVEVTFRLNVAGEVKTVRIKSVLLRDAQGQAVRVLGVDLDISELYRLEGDNLRLRLRQQQALFEAVQAAEEEERRRMSESLHNGIGQILYATKLQLDRLPNTPELSPRQEAARLLSEAIRQTRTLSHELTPSILEDFGLEKALESICGTLNGPALRWRCHLNFEEGPALPMPMPLQLAVYRLAQELAQNVLKHSQATQATLELDVLSAWVVLRVEDNGRGFDPAHTGDGLGLRSMRSRVALLGGHVHLTTAPGQGTQCQIRIPLAPPAP